MVLCKEKYWTYEEEWVVLVKGSMKVTGTAGIEFKLEKGPHRSQLGAAPYTVSYVGWNGRGATPATAAVQ